MKALLFAVAARMTRRQAAASRIDNEGIVAVIEAARNEHLLVLVGGLVIWLGSHEAVVVLELRIGQIDKGAELEEVRAKS